MDILSVGDRLLGLAGSLWRRHRFRARVQISLGWEHLPILSLDGTDPRWRAIAVEVTSPKADEFVIAKGSAEAKVKSRRWTPVCELADLLNLPIVVPANRQWQGSLSGQFLAAKIKTVPESLDALTLRLILEDHHGSKVRSNSLAVTLPELVREERV